MSASTSKVQPPLLPPPQNEESRVGQVQLSLKPPIRSANPSSSSSIVNNNCNNSGVDGASIKKNSSSATATTTNTANESDDAFVLKREEVLITDLLYKLHRRTTKLVDTHVVCQDGYIPVHRCVLMACSKFLWELLVNEDPAELAAVCLPDFTVEQVLPLINSFYTGCITFNQSELTSIVEIISMLQADTNITYSFQPAKEQDKRWAPKMRHYLESSAHSDGHKQQNQHHGNKNDNQHHQLQARLGSGATTQRKTSKISSAAPLEKENDPSTQKTSVRPEGTETEASNRVYLVDNEPNGNENSNNSDSPIEVDIEEIEDNDEEEEEEQICHYEENSDEEVEMDLLTGAHLNIDADVEEFGNVTDTFEDDSNVFSPTTADLVNDVIIRPEGTASQTDDDDDERDPLEFESLLVDEDFVEESDSLQGRTFEFETIAFDEDGQHKQIAQIITEPLPTTMTTTTTISAPPPQPQPPSQPPPIKSTVTTISKSKRTKKSMKEKRQQRRRAAELRKVENLRKQQVEAELRSQQLGLEKRNVDHGGAVGLLAKKGSIHKRRDESEDRLLKAQEHKTRMEEIRFSQELQEKIQQSLASTGRFSQTNGTATSENIDADKNERVTQQQSPVEENRRVLRVRDKVRTPLVAEEAVVTRRQSNERVTDSQRKKTTVERQKADKGKEKLLQGEEEKRNERSKQDDEDNDTRKSRVDEKQKKSDVQIKNVSVNIQKLSIPRALEQEQRRQHLEKGKRVLAAVEEDKRAAAEEEKRLLAEAAEKEKRKLTTAAAEEEKRRTSERELKRKRVEELKRVKAEEQKKLKAEKELQAKKIEEAKRQKEIEEECRKAQEEKQSRLKLQAEEEKKRDELKRKEDEETRKKQEEDTGRKELERIAEEKRVEEELNAKVEENMKQSSEPSKISVIDTASVLINPTTTVTQLVPANSEPLVLDSIILPAEKSHTPNEQPRRKTTKFYEELFQKRRQAEEERRRKEREEEEKKRQQELKNSKEKTNAAKELIDILEGNDSTEASKVPVSGLPKETLSSKVAPEPIPTEPSEPVVSEPIPSKPSEQVSSAVAPIATVDVESIPDEVSKSISTPPSAEQAMELTESQESITPPSTDPEVTSLSEVPINQSTDADQVSQQEQQELEVAREVLVDVSTTSAEPQQLYEFVDDIPQAIQETVVVTTEDDFFMDTDTINEVEVETEESGFNSGSMGRNSSEDGDDRTSYEKVLEGCEQAVRSEQTAKGTTTTAQDSISETAESSPVEGGIVVSRKESTELVESADKTKSDEDSDVPGTLRQRQRKKKKNRKVREKHTQTKPQDKLTVLPKDVVLSTADATATATTIPAVSVVPSENAASSGSTSSAAANWTTTQGNGTTLCIKRSLEPLSMAAAAAALTRNPNRRYKVISSVGGKTIWVQNPKVVLSRLSKRQYKYYSNRLSKYLASRKGNTPPPTLTKATNSSSTSSKKLKSGVKKMIVPVPARSSLAPSASRSKSISRSQSYDTDGRPPRLEPQNLPSSSSSSKQQKRPASVPQSSSNYERRSFSASSSYVPQFDPVWYQDELKRCANCKRKYKVHTKATNCLLNHGFRRCWICLDLLPSHDASYEQHCTKFHALDKQGDRVRCPICGKTLMMRGLPMHVTRKHLQPPEPAPNDILPQPNFHQHQSERDMLQQLYRPQPVVFNQHHHMQQQQLYGHDQYYHQQPPPFHPGIPGMYPTPPHPQMELQHQPYEHYEPPPPMINLYPQHEILQPIKLDLKKIEKNRERVRLSESEDENDDSDNGTTTTRTSTPSDLDDIDNLHGDSLSSSMHQSHPTAPVETDGSRQNDIHSLEATSPSKQSVITHGPLSSKYVLGRAHSPTSIAGSLYAFKESNVGVPIQLIPNPSTQYIDEELARRAYQPQYQQQPAAVESEITPVPVNAPEQVDEQQQEQEQQQHQPQVELECNSDQQQEQQVQQQPQQTPPQQTPPHEQQQQMSPEKSLHNSPPSEIPVTTTNIDEDLDIVRRAYQYPIDDSTIPTSKSSTGLVQQMDQECSSGTSPTAIQLDVQQLTEQHQEHQQQHQQQHQASPVYQEQQLQHQSDQQYQQQYQQHQQDQFAKNLVDQIQQHQVSHSQSHLRIPDRDRDNHMKRQHAHKDNMLQLKKRILHSYNEPPYPGHYDQHRKLDHPHAHHHSPYSLALAPHTPYYFYGGGQPSGRDLSPRISSSSQVQQTPPPAHFAHFPTHNPHLHHHHHHSNHHHHQQPPPAQHSLTSSIREIERFPMPNQDVTMDETGNLYCELRNVNYNQSPIPLSSYNSSGNHNGPKAIPASSTDYDARPSSIFATPPLPPMLEEAERQQQQQELQPAHQQQQQHNVLWDHGGLRSNESQTQSQLNQLSQLSLEYINRANVSNNVPKDFPDGSEGYHCARCGENVYIRENLESHRCTTSYLSH